MSIAPAIRRITILVTIVLLAAGVGVAPLYAIDSDNASSHAGTVKKKGEQKRSKADAKKPVETTSQSAPGPYLPDPPHGGGY
jgi:flagellar basal body-associated protein FliL